MFDQRLIQLRRAGYSPRQLERLTEHFPETALDAIAQCETPNEAKEIFNQQLADLKVTFDDEPTNSTDD